MYYLTGSGTTPADSLRRILGFVEKKKSKEEKKKFPAGGAMVCVTASGQRGYEPSEVMSPLWLGVRSIT